MFNNLKHKLMGKLLPGTEELVKLQQEIMSKTFKGTAAEGKVVIVLKGTFELVKVELDEEYVRSNDAEQIAKDIKKAYKKAMQKIHRALRGAMFGI